MQLTLFFPACASNLHTASAIYKRLWNPKFLTEYSSSSHWIVTCKTSSPIGSFLIILQPILFLATTVSLSFFFQADSNPYTFTLSTAIFQSFIEFRLIHTSKYRYCIIEEKKKYTTLYRMTNFSILNQFYVRRYVSICLLSYS